jgi:4-hydroxy-4-methyl-2-oxoglutarate aldolase
MYTVNPLPPQVDPDLLALLLEAEPATIGHFLHFGFVDPMIRALQPNVRIAGTAVPVRLAGPDGTIVHYALGQVRPGDILVLDRSGDHKHAACGGAVAYAARKAGVLGIIVDGVVADLGELREYRMPVWARGASAVTTKRCGLGGEFCVTASCGGVTVEPGDAILADENGVLVLKPHQIEAAASRAIAMQAAEKTTLARLDAGEKMPDITGATKMVLDNLSK